MPLLCRAFTSMLCYISANIPNKTGDPHSAEFRASLISFRVISNLHFSSNRIDQLSHCVPLIRPCRKQIKCWLMLDQ